MEQVLILNDGTRLFPAHAILSSGVLWVYLDGGLTLTEAFTLLNDSEKTCHIIADEYGTISEYMDYTVLFCIRVEDNGQVNAGLKKVVS